MNIDSLIECVKEDFEFLFDEYEFEIEHTAEERLTQVIGLRSEKYSVQLYGEAGLALSIGHHDAAFYDAGKSELDPSRWYDMSLLKAFLENENIDWKMPSPLFNRALLKQVSSDLRPIIDDVFELISNKERVIEFRRFEAEQIQKIKEASI